MRATSVGLQPFSSLGGTRHISAAQFAFDQPGAISIVASQDGNVTFFTREAETGGILTMQQAEMALLHEGLGGSLWNLSLFSEMGWLEKGCQQERKRLSRRLCPLDAQHLLNGKGERPIGNVAALPTGAVQSAFRN